MLAAVISIFAAAALAPFVVRALGHRSAWLIAIVPAVCFALLAARVDGIAHGQPIDAAVAALTPPADPVPAASGESAPAAESGDADEHPGEAHSEDDHPEGTDPEGEHAAGPDAADGHGDAHGDAAGHAVHGPADIGNRAAGDRQSHAWITTDGPLGFDVNLALRLDGLSVLFALLITGIGTLVVIYTGGYLKDHEQLPRFLGVLLAFMGSMLGLVLADDVVTLFVFWEGTSVTSFLLIGFDRHRAAARRAAMQALVVTGSGGLAMLAGLMLLANAAGTFSIAGMIEAREAIQASPQFVPALILILAGCFTKSAQFPFHFWLPNAMEAPTPVSSYLHSATMVKAGVYLIARMNPVFGGAAADGGPGIWETALVGFAGFTAVLCAVLALRQYSLKKLLAYSTTSSLSLMILGIGLGTEKAAVGAIAFLLAHALYKCCLFQTAGNITHATGEKDVKRLGGLGPAMPIAATAGILGGASMIGVPGFFGFLGKGALLYASSHGAYAAIFATAAIIIAGASFVMIGATVGVLPFLRGPRETARTPHEPELALWLGPLVLGILGVVLGVGFHVGAELFVGPGASSVRGAVVEAHLSYWHGMSGLVLEAVMIGLGLLLLWRRDALEMTFTRMDPILSRGPDRGYDVVIAGVRGLARLSTGILQNGSLRWYLVTVLGFATIVVGWVLRDGLNEFRNISYRESVADIQAHEAITVVCIVLGCYAMVRTRSRLSAIGALGLVGYGVALIFVFFGAPDLAITQFLIETLSVLLLVLVFWKLPSFKHLSGPKSRIRDAVIAVVFGAMMTVLVLVGSQSEIGDRDARDFYAATSYEEAHGRNIVNVILVDYRGVDTMGEITVLMIAALGVYGLIKLPGAAADARSRSASGSSEAPAIAAPKKKTRSKKSKAGGPDAGGDGA